MWRLQKKKRRLQEAKSRGQGSTVAAMLAPAHLTLRSHCGLDTSNKDVFERRWEQEFTAREEHLPGSAVSPGPHCLLGLGGGAVSGEAEKQKAKTRQLGAVG